MELDPLPPPPLCFYDRPREAAAADAEGDFDFRRCRLEGGPDIWQKFELLLPGPAAAAAEEEEEEEEDGRPGNPSAFVLRDCMWSAGFERLAAKGAPGPGSAAHAHAAGAHDPGLGGLCVAPGAVFAWPAGGGAVGGGGAANAAPPEGKPPASSGSESQSDSEGEEIDVVTVEKRQSLSARKPVTITVRADPWDPCMKHFHIAIHQQQHNYAARSPPEVLSRDVASEKSARQEEEEDEEDDDASEARGEGGLRCPGQAAECSSASSFLLKPGSAPSSDGEDVSKRRNHNYLERKRRNDLRSRFLALRDQVPGLAACPKTPKVVVLSKASEYLQSLLSAEREMVAQKKLLKLRQLQLLKRLSHLQGVR